MNIDFINETEYKVDPKEFIDLVVWTLKDQEVDSEVECNILLINPDDMQILNRDWHNDNAPTDVLSFPMDELKPHSSSTHPPTKSKKLNQDEAKVQDEKFSDFATFGGDAPNLNETPQIYPHGILGDIVLCPQVCEANAKKDGHSLNDEMLLLTVHSVLHLLGYDHQEESQKEKMFALQKKILLDFLASRS